MSEQLITVGEAAQKIGVTSELPSNKCLTKAEFDELLNGKGYEPIIAPNGVYIMHKNGRLFSKQYWKYPGSDASGIAVKSDKCSFVIYPLEIPTKWGGEGDIILKCTTTINSSAAQRDYNGKQNTDAIVEKLGGTQTYAASYCKRIMFSHGVNGYLPSLGELYEAYQNKLELDICMQIIGGVALFDKSKNNFLKWCSTQYDSVYAWALDWDEGNMHNYNKNNITDVYARAFGPL